VSDSTWLDIDNVLASAATQARKKIDPDLVAQYVEDIANGAKFPALVVFVEKNSERYILADGFHRLQAYVESDYKQVEVEVHEGDLHAAFRYALGSNCEHGARRTNADKRHVVELALKDPDVSQRPVQEIADICRVNEKTIRRIREEQLDKSKNKGSGGKDSKGKAADAKPEDQRSTRPEPTQEEVDMTELRTAMGLIKALPYGGEDVTKLSPNKDDVADFEYAAAWLSHAVLVMRRPG